MKQQLVGAAPFRAAGTDPGFFSTLLLSHALTEMEARTELIFHDFSDSIEDHEYEHGESVYCFDYSNPSKVLGETLCYSVHCW